MFYRFSSKAAKLFGTPIAFSLACFIILVWAVSGPFMGFDSRWQLTINTTTTIVTFLMVFLIQATQNRQEKAIQEKLDDLLQAIEGTHPELIGKGTDE